MKVDDIERLKSKCRDFARTTKSIDVLRMADGRTHYSEIAKRLEIHPTTVSGILKKADNYDFARRVRKGVYKKIQGILGYMPKKGGVVSSGIELSKRMDVLVKPRRTVNAASLNFGLKVSANFESQVKRMADTYQYLYAVENVLRELIRKVFKGDGDWWKNKVSPDIQLKVSKAIQEAPYHALKRKDELEYTHLGQLKEIIISGKNWKDFLPHLKTKDKNDFSVTINRAIPSRNAIGHCIPLDKEDFTISEVRFRDVLKMIK